MPQLPSFQGPAVPPAQAAGVQIETPSNQGAQAIAGAIGGVVDEFAQTQLNILRRQNEIDVLSQETKYGDAMAAAQSKLNRNDPSKWNEEISSASKSFMDELETSDLAPDAKSSLRSRLTGYQSKIMRQVARDAQLTQVEIVKGEYSNRQQVSRENADFEGMRENIKASASTMGMLEHEVESALMRVDREERDYILESSRSSDPFKLLESLESGEFKMNNLELQREIEKTNQAVNSRRREIYSDTLNGIISNPALSDEEIESLSQRLTPIGREKLINVAHDRRDKSLQDVIKSDDYQTRLIGDLTSFVITFDPLETKDTEAEMDFLNSIDQIQNKHERDRLMSLYDGAFKEQIEQQDSDFKEGMKVLNGHFKRLEEKVEKPEAVVNIRTVRDHVGDGFIEDAEKLQSLGFSGDQIKDIQEADEDLDSSILGSLFTADNEVTINAKADKFKELWDQRTGDVTADRDALELARKIAKGRGGLDNDFSKIESVNPEAQLAYDKERNRIIEEKGLAHREYMQWAARNPKVDYNEHLNKISDLGVKVQQESARKHSLPRSRSVSGAGRSFRTNLKLSNYGYASDSTPDSFSKKSVGHASNRLRDEQSAAISKSLAVELGLKRGAVLEIQTSKGSRLVTYDDTVPATDKRTGHLPPTIDIFRKSGGSNKWGGRVNGVKLVIQGRDGISGREYSRFSQQNYERARRMVSNHE